MAKKAKQSKNNGSKNKTTRRGLRGIQQGVGKPTKTAFGSTAATTKSFDAFDVQHLPLPRPVGAYTVIRTTEVVNSNKEVMIFARELAQSTSAGVGMPNNMEQWSDVIARTYGTGGFLGTINGPSNCQTFKDDGTNSLGPAATMVPSAFSVQLMNPNALQTTSGIIYGGRSKTQLQLADRNLSWETFAKNFVSYQAPRLMSAGKLALNGVQIDATPMNMSALSDFRGKLDSVGGNTTWNGVASDAGTSGTPTGFSPIVVYNPQAVNLQYLVCTEWRIRFDFSHPASSSHTQHGMAHENVWHKAICDMERVGNGARDIAETVAMAGQAVSTGINAVKAVRAAAAPIALLAA